MSLHIFENLFAVYGFKNVAVFDKTNALFGCNIFTHSRLKMKKNSEIKNVRERAKIDIFWMSETLVYPIRPK